MALQNWSFIYGLFAGSTVYAIFKWFHDRKSRKKKDFETVDPIFFSPKAYSIKCQKETSDKFCQILFCSACNFKKVCNVLSTAKSSLDICVYLITSEKLSNLIIKLFKDGVFVRIIIDKSMSCEAQKSKMYIFIKEHIPIKLSDLGEMMHNKFAIIDERTVITGSFNWTNQGMLYNCENGVVIQNKKVAKKFGEYFQNLWLTPNKKL